MREIRGVHVIVDGYVESDAVFDASSMRAMFDTLVDALHMKYLTPPLCCDVPLEATKLDSEEDEGGRSWFCQITTSHIALHAWPLRKAFMMDIFSCKPFDHDTAMAIIRHSLKLTDWSIYVLDRFDPIRYFEGSAATPEVLFKTTVTRNPPTFL